MPEEKKRIYRYGGEVRKLKNDYCERIFVRGRVFPCLATSRTLGNDIANMIGVINEPDVFSVEIMQEDLFLMIGTDSVFSYLEDNEILNVMNYADNTKLRECTEMLLKKAKNAWIENDNNCFEDMTLACVYFQ